MQRALAFILIVFFTLAGRAQNPPDSVRTDSALLANPSARLDSAQLAQWQPPPLPWDSLLLAQHPFIRFTGAVRPPQSVRVWQGKEHFFYLCTALLIFFALIKNGFGKYLQDLFRIFFRSTLKQRQVKEQLMQAPLPSLLLNLLFLFAGAFFICLVLQHFGLAAQHSFWILFLYSAAGLAVIYLIKYITLKLCGWLFRLSDATNTYIFIVLTTNKIIGISLLPFVVLLSFTTGLINQTFFTLSLILLGGLFLYRYYLSYTSVQKQIKLQAFHFLLYLLAFELVPLLLINKLLVKFVPGTQ